MQNIKPFKILRKEGQYLLLKYYAINGRTIVCWYNTEFKDFGISLFSYFDNPKKDSIKSIFGYVTKFMSFSGKSKEAFNMVNKYIANMKKNNFYWENNNLH